MTLRATCLRIAGLAALCLLLAGCAEALEKVQKASDTLSEMAQEHGIVAASEDQLEDIYQEGLAFQSEGDHEAAAARFRTAAEGGHAAAAYELSQAYRNGLGVAQDEAEADRWLAAAAERGDTRGQYLLGVAYANGVGVEQDEKRAAYWLGEAATRGHVDAQFLLAEAFAHGRGVPEDPAWAARWYGKAAYQGHREAQRAYGLMFAAGRGLPNDPVRAYRWLTIAANAGDAKAAEARAKLAPRLSAAELSATESAAAVFHPEANTRFADPPTIMYVQGRLNALGFPAGPVDGVLGPRTHEAIGEYQDARGMTADGEVTPDLLVALLKESRG